MTDEQRGPSDRGESDDATVGPRERTRTELFEALYDELRLIAARTMRAERPDHTLQPTALVHELWLELDGQSRARWSGETHFRAAAALLMSRLLKEHARRRGARKRGGGWTRVTLDEGVALVPGRDEDADALAEAMEELRSLDPDVAGVVECRLVGLTEVEIAELRGVSERTVRSDWAWARTWLRRRLDPELDRDRDGR